MLQLLWQVSAFGTHPDLTLSISVFGCSWFVSFSVIIKPVRVAHSWILPVFPVNYWSSRIVGTPKFIASLPEGREPGTPPGVCNEGRFMEGCALCCEAWSNSMCLVSELHCREQKRKRKETLGILGDCWNFQQKKLQLYPSLHLSWILCGLKLDTHCRVFKQVSYHERLVKLFLKVFQACFTGPSSLGQQDIKLAWSLLNKHAAHYETTNNVPTDFELSWVPIVAYQKRLRLGTLRLRVGSLALLKGPALPWAVV